MKKLRVKGVPITTGDRHTGIELRYDQRHKLITISGWYDSIAGIRPETVRLARLLFMLGITLADCEDAYAGISFSRCANCEATAWVKFDGEASTCLDEPRCIAAVRAKNEMDEGWESDDV